MAEQVVTPDAFESLASTMHPAVQTVQQYWAATAKPLIIQHVIPHCPPPLQAILANDATYLAFAATFLLIILVVIIRALASPAAGSHGAPAVLFLGPCDSGKTALLLTLQGHPTQGTVASIKENDAVVTLGGRSVRIVDIPGHPRVRGAALAAYAPQASKILFVINSVDFMAQRGDTAECVRRRLCESWCIPFVVLTTLCIVTHTSLLYRLLVDVLTNPHVARRRPPILMVCTRGDAGVRAHTCDFVRKMLEKEIEAIRNSRHALDDGERRKGVLGAEGAPFSFASHATATGVRVAGWVQLASQDAAQVAQEVGGFVAA